MLKPGALVGAVPLDSRDRMPPERPPVAPAIVPAGSRPGAAELPIAPRWWERRPLIRGIVAHRPLPARALP